MKVLSLTLTRRPIRNSGLYFHFLLQSQYDVISSFKEQW